MLDRLLGTETEYAIRFRAAPGVPHPGNEVLYDAIRAAVSQIVHTRPGQGLADSVRRRVFTENGGSLYYEFVPQQQQGGLVEAGTPECRGPSQWLLYQKAQDHLLAQAVRRAEADLRARGLGGELSLLKNCRDGAGNTYGAQESYEVDLGTGPALLGWRLSILAVLPLAVFAGLIHWGLLLLTLAVSLPLGGLVLLIGAGMMLTGRGELDFDRHAERFSRLFDVLTATEVLVAQVAMTPSTLVTSLAARLFAFRPYRRGAMAFLVTRTIFSGAGTLMADGSLGLSEKGPAMRRVMRRSVLPGDRGILEIGHLIKPLHAVAFLDWRGVLSLFRRRQRLQLGLSDANLCQTAEWLKIGTTALVLDLVEAGRLNDAPVPYDPVTAHQAIAADPRLRSWISLRGGGTATALDVQRFYHQRAAEWLKESETVGMEAHEVVKRWGEVLAALEQGPGALIGRVDWITKRHLLDETRDLDDDARKKIDLRYHELGTGYHAMLEEAGGSPRLISEEDAERATREPPADSPARERGRLVRTMAEADVDARFSWDHVRVAGPMGGTVIDLREAQERRRRGTTGEER